MHFAPLCIEILNLYIYITLYIYIIWMNLASLAGEFATILQDPSQNVNPNPVLNSSMSMLWHQVGSCQWLPKISTGPNVCPLNASKDEAGTNLCPAQAQGWDWPKLAGSEHSESVRKSIGNAEVSIHYYNPPFLILSDPSWRFLVLYQHSIINIGYYLEYIFIMTVYYINTM